MSRLMRPPYIDPTTGIAYDTDKGDYEGYLTKQSMWLRVSLFTSYSFMIHCNPRLTIFRVSYYIIFAHMNIRTGDDDSSSSKAHGCSLQKPHMKLHMVWLIWVDVQLSSPRIWKLIRNTALKLVLPKQPTCCMLVRTVVVYIMLMVTKYLKPFDLSILCITLHRWWKIQRWLDRFCRKINRQMLKYLCFTRRSKSGGGQRNQE